MKVEIWSDVMCPFCYIGKRRFEKALEAFPRKDQVEVVWKSFQLNPSMKTKPGKNITQYLADVKGWTLEQAQEANSRVTDMAREVGLDYQMDKAVVANSFDAHRLLQLAKSTGRGDAMEEALFRAYFTEGKNIADSQVLQQLAVGAGLDESEVASTLASAKFSDQVSQDIYEASQIGVRGVPFFVFNDRYSVSGAQASETFAGALAMAWKEFEAVAGEKSARSREDDDNTCTIGDDC